VVRTELAEGPVPSKELWSRLEAAGFRPATIRRACEVIGVRRERRGENGGQWLCALPPDGAG
jgi:hypothetical protein